jgi:hypothetical protein
MPLSPLDPIEDIVKFVAWGYEAHATLTLAKCPGLSDTCQM